MKIKSPKENNNTIPRGREWKYLPRDKERNWQSPQKHLYTNIIISPYQFYRKQLLSLIVSKHKRKDEFNFIQS